MQIQVYFFFVNSNAITFLHVYLSICIHIYYIYIFKIKSSFICIYLLFLNMFVLSDKFKHLQWVKTCHEDSWNTNLLQSIYKPVTFEVAAISRATPPPQEK